MANWSDLPLDLLHLISTLTATNSSTTRRLRSVCSWWRSSVHPKPSTTYFHSPTIIFSTSQTHQLELRLVKQTTFLLSLSFDHNSCWVVKVEEHKPGVFHLLSNPFSNIQEFNNDYNILDLTNVDTLELGHKYVLLNDNNDNGHMRLDHDIEHNKVGFIFSSGNNNFILLSIHNSTGKLLIYKSNIKKWVFLDDDRGEFVYDWSLRYADVVENEGKFYAITDSGKTVIIELNNDFSVDVNLMVKSIIGGDKKCLLKSGEDLLLVDLYTCQVKGSLEVNAIDVYKLEKEDKKWVLLTSLGGRTIFLSKNSSFCASNLHGIKENCIYFSFKNNGNELDDKKGGNMDDSVGYYDEDEMKINEIGVFNYDKGKFGSFEEDFEDSKLFCWPPPSWVNLLFSNKY